MSSLPTQPYQVSDFSGGLTENFIGGGPTRYMAADNLWITVDKKIEERYGSTLIDSTNYQLPSGNSPVNALIAHDNEQFLLGVGCPNIYVLNPNWFNIVGPSGNPPLAGGNYSNQISWAEWSHHTLITNDSLSTKPIKIFRGAGYPIQMVSPTVQVSPQIPPTNISSFQAITAGLPSMATAGTQNIPNSALLTNAITLANDIRTNMILHIVDAGGSINTTLHAAQDSTDLAILNSFGSCYDLPSLLTLTTNLISAFTGHINDALSLIPTYHYNPAGVPGPLRQAPDLPRALGARRPGQWCGGGVV